MDPRSLLRLVVVLLLLVAAGLTLRNCETRIRNEVVAAENVKDAKAVATVTRKDAKVAAGLTQKATTIEAEAKEADDALEQQIATQPVFSAPQCVLDADSLRIINQARGAGPAAAPGGAGAAVPGSGAGAGRSPVHTGADAAR